MNDFPGYEHSEWPLKRVITAESYAAMGGRVKIIAVLTGVFLGTLTAPYCTCFPHLPPLALIDRRRALP